MSSKDVSDVNKRENLIQDRKRKGNELVGPRGPRPKLNVDTALETPEAYKERRRLEDAKKLESLLQHFADVPRGSAQPQSKVINHWNRPRKALLVFHHPGAEQPTWVLAVYIKFDLQYEIPSLRIRNWTGTHTIRIRPINISNESDKKGAFRKGEYSVDTMDNSTLVSYFNQNHRTPGLDEVSADKAIDFGREQGEHTQQGIHCLTWELRGEDNYLWDEYPIEPMDYDPHMEDLMGALRYGKSSVVTLVRQLVHIREPLERYWQNRMQACVNKGVLNFYSKQIGTVTGSLFSEFIRDPTKKLEYQTCMKVKKPSGLAKVVSNTIRKRVGDLREFEIQESVGTIYDSNHEDDVIQAYFTYSIIHDACVVRSEEGWVEIDVKVHQSDQHAMPRIKEGSKFKVRLIEYGQNPETVMDVDDSDEEGPFKDVLFEEPREVEAKPDRKCKGKAVEIKGKETVNSTKKRKGAKPPPGPVYNAHFIDVPSQKDFVVGFFVYKDQDRPMFVEGEDIKVNLKMDRNTVPAIRQLRAVAKISIPATPKNGGHKRELLQKFLMGHGNVDAQDPNLPSIKEDFTSRLTDEGKQIMKVVHALGDEVLNKRQNTTREFCLSTRNTAVQMQGPPGTGKTYTLAFIGVELAFLKCTVLLTAPSNNAVDSMLASTLATLEVIYHRCPQAKGTFNIVYITTNINTRQDIAKIGDEDAEAQAHTLLTEGEQHPNHPFKQYRLWSHIVRSIKARVNLGVGTEQAKADDLRWATIHDRMKAKQLVNGKDKVFFTKFSGTEGIAAMKDKKTRMVFSTCNNSAVLQSNFSPFAVIVDESAFSKVKEVYIPLALIPRMVLFGGDHEQLRPFNGSQGFNPEANQDSLSLFEKWIGHHNIPLVRLKIGRRCHPDIANFPAMISYTWLECHPSTLIEGPEYLYFKSWFNRSGNKWRLARRNPLWKGGRSEHSIRRLLISPKGGRSGTRPGSTSLVNYANVNAISDLVESLFSHPVPDGIADLPGHNVTIMAPYADQTTEIARQVRWKLRGIDIQFKNFPAVIGADKMQGNENEIIIACLTTANEHHGSIIGFLREYNRLNVIQTRAKQVFILVGNIERWRSELIVLVKGLKCKRLALLIIDFLDLGDVIDVDAHHLLPASEDESRNIPKDDWSLEQPSPDFDDCQLSDRNAALLTKYNRKAREVYELELLKELQQYRSEAERLRLLSVKGVDEDLPVFHRIEGEGRDEHPEEEDDAPDREAPHKDVDADTAVKNSNPPTIEAPPAAEMDIKMDIEMDVETTLLKEAQAEGGNEPLDAWKNRTADANGPDSDDETESRSVDDAHSHHSLGDFDPEEIEKATQLSRGLHTLSVDAQRNLESGSSSSRTNLDGAQYQPDERVRQPVETGPPLVPKVKPANKKSTNPLMMKKAKGEKRLAKQEKAKKKAEAQASLDVELEGKPGPAGP
jgi:hypothetical protein